MTEKSPKTAKAVKITYKAASTVVIAALVIVCLLMILPRLWGLHTYAVLSGSMRPTMPEGTLLLVHPVKFDDIEQGDVAVFQSKKNPESRFTHRVVGINADDRTLTTKGDASSFADPLPAHESSLVGKVVAGIPFAGLPAYLLSGFYRRIIAAALVVLWMSIEIELRVTAKEKHTQSENDGQLT